MFFLELSCFSNDPADVGNLISGSSAFSKTSLNICDRLLSAAERNYPLPRSGAATESARLRRHRSGKEELLQAQGQGQWPRGATPRLRSSGCMGAGGPRGAASHSRSGVAAVRRYPLSKIMSSGCALLEQPWRDTPRPR